MTPESGLPDLAIVGLCLVGLIGSIMLTARRFRFFGIHTRLHRRLVLVDLMIVLTLVELTADALAESALVVDPLREVLHLLAIVGRGAIVTGVIALMVTFPGDEEPTKP